MLGHANDKWDKQRSSVSLCVRVYDRDRERVCECECEWVMLEKQSVAIIANEPLYVRPKWANKWNTIDWNSKKIVRKTKAKNESDRIEKKEMLTE